MKLGLVDLHRRLGHLQVGDRGLGLFSIGGVRDAPSWEPLEKVGHGGLGQTQWRRAGSSSDGWGHGTSVDQGSGIQLGSRLPLDQGNNRVNTLSRDEDLAGDGADAAGPSKT